jgi:UPF0042 nucleotide-binding protein
MGEGSKNLNIVIITGLSGAGKTLAATCLEDLGYFCVDNLPPALLPKFIELADRSEDVVQKVAFGIDVRGGQFFNDLSSALEEMGRMGYHYQILFLDTSPEVLVRRFKESRRPHPLATGSLLEAIKQERTLLEDVRGQANVVIDTSDKSPGELKEELTRLFGADRNSNAFNVTIISFGYKLGLPMDADLVMDVRFLPNPYYENELRDFTGLDQNVASYVLENDVTRTFITEYSGLLSFLLPNYVKEGKTHLMIAVGCTGGQHRSVVLAEYLSAALQKDGYEVSVKHRDLHRYLTGRGNHDREA